MATECDIAWTMIGQAAQGARDTDLVDTGKACERETATQLKWLKTRGLGLSGPPPVNTGGPAEWEVDGA